MLFGAVDSWLERISAGQIRRPQPGEKECMHLRFFGSRGTCVFGAAGLHSAMEAFRASARSTNRFFFGFLASAFLTAATWRAVTPTAPVH
eukprot:Skav205114  [mRNA]  locus=scaffold1864:145218:145650:+ [translate_table: standard]